MALSQTKTYYAPCDLNENAPPPCSYMFDYIVPVGGTVNEGLGGVAFLEEVCY